MGNLFSNVFEENPTSAPSGSYTVTPATTSSETTTTSTSNDSTTQSSSQGCSPGTVPLGTTSGSSNGTTTTTTTTSAPPAGPPVSTSDNQFQEFLNDIFNATTFTILFWIIVMYITYSFGVEIFKDRGTSGETSGVSSYSRTIDILILILVFVICLQGYLNLTNEQRENMVGWSLEWTEQYLDNPWNLFYLIWFTIIFFVLVYILRVPMEKGVKPILVNFVEKKIWILYLTFFIIFFFKYLLNIPIVTLLFNNSIVRYFEGVPPFSSSPGVFSQFEDDLLGAPSTESTTTTNDLLSASAPGQAQCETANQVFNVSNNLYTYEEAQKVCAAFDASLANYNQIESAYNNGAEWCNYGWSEGQMAYFPTQKTTYEKLQKNPNTKHACGRPGINGGFIDNPYIKFGANCYGVKPPKPDGWVESAPFEECEANPDQEEMEKLKNMAKLNDFNRKKWSRY
tara:strand:+ start:3313 stop:4674 length:1362 start_codon:yes stop_codon:yes gene_type:complete